MIITLIICITLVLCLVLLLKWAKDMATAGLPMFTYGQLVWKDDNTADKKPNVIGFSAEPEEKELSDQEKLEKTLADSASTISALLRGEVDFDDIKN